MRIRVFLLFSVLLVPAAAWAHVGSPDVYYDSHAGPYHLLVTVRPPAVIPGIAEIQIRSDSTDIKQIQILPLRMTGIAARLAPQPDVARPSATDPHLFTGSLWLMTRGSWKVQIKVDGAQGNAELAVPVAAVSGGSSGMQKALGILLGCLGVLLVAGMIGIIGAANREADLAPAEQPSSAKKRRGIIGMAVMASLIGVILFLGNAWWKAEALTNDKLSYRLPHLQSSVDGNLLRVELATPEPEERAQFRLENPERLRNDDLLPDHGHLMHLFLVRTPDMKSFWHLHPGQLGPGNFSDALPDIPPGHYQIYADIVHHTGFPETFIGEIDLSGVAGKPLHNDDAGVADMSADEKVSQLSDGYRMVWEKDAAPLRTKEPIRFNFRVEDKNGNPAADLENYMGMPGHAVFIRNDGKVFAHVHPAGSVSMAAAELAQDGSSDGSGPMAGMQHGHLSSEVSFPYGFPQPGDYHIFVQVKRAGKIETGAFLAHVK